MQIEHRFRVPAAPDEVFALLVDVERVTPCLPGAEIVGRRADGGYDGRMKVKLGPLRMTYRGTLEIAASDVAARSATLVARAVEARGQGAAHGAIEMSVAAADAGSAVTVSADVRLTGRVAQMGQGVVQDVAASMIGEMAGNLQRLLDEAPPSAAAADPLPPASDPQLSGSAAVAEAEAVVAAAARKQRRASIALRTLVWAAVRGRFQALGRRLRAPARRA